MDVRRDCVKFAQRFLICPGAKVAWLLVDMHGAPLKLGWVETTRPASLRPHTITLLHAM